MSRAYNAIISSTNSRIDGKPVLLRVGESVWCKLKSVDPLNYDPTNVEKRWYAEQVIPNIIGR